MSKYVPPHLRADIKIWTNKRSPTKPTIQSEPVAKNASSSNLFEIIQNDEDDDQRKYIINEEPIEKKRDAKSTKPAPRHDETWEQYKRREKPKATPTERAAKIDNMNDVAIARKKLLTAITENMHTNDWFSAGNSILLREEFKPVWAELSDKDVTYIMNWLRSLVVFYASIEEDHRASVMAICDIISRKPVAGASIREELELLLPNYGDHQLVYTLAAILSGHVELKCDRNPKRPPKPYYTENTKGAPRFVPFVFQNYWTRTTQPLLTRDQESATWFFTQLYKAVPPEQAELVFETTLIILEHFEEAAHKVIVSCMDQAGLYSVLELHSTHTYWRVAMYIGHIISHIAHEVSDSKYTSLMCKMILHYDKRFDYRINKGLFKGLYTNVLASSDHIQIIIDNNIVSIILDEFERSQGTDTFQQTLWGLLLCMLREADYAHFVKYEERLLRITLQYLYVITQGVADYHFEVEVGLAILYHIVEHNEAHREKAQKMVKDLLEFDKTILSDLASLVRLYCVHIDPSILDTLPSGSLSHIYGFTVFKPKFLRQLLIKTCEVFIYKSLKLIKAGFLVALMELHSKEVVTATISLCEPYYSTLASDMDKMLHDAPFADATFTAEGTKFPVHKFVLKARCPSLLTFLQNDTIDFETSPEVLKQLRNYIYTNRVDRRFASQLQDIAEKYQMPSLIQRLCSEEYSHFAEVVQLETELQEAFKNPSFADIDLQLEDGTSIKVNKAVLSTRSNWAKSLSALPTKEAMSSVWNLSEYNQEAILAMICFMYSNKLPEKMSTEEALNLWIIFEFFQLDNTARLLIEAKFFAQLDANTTSLEDVKDIISKHQLTPQLFSILYYIPEKDLYSDDEGSEDASDDKRFLHCRVKDSIWDELSKVLSKSRDHWAQESAEEIQRHKVKRIQW